MRTFRSLLLLIPILLFTGIWSLALGQNPGDQAIISGKFISLSGETITLETGDFQAGNTQNQDFTLTPGFQVLDARDNNNNVGTGALVPGMFVSIQGVIGQDGNPIYDKVVIDANQPGEPPPDDNPPPNGEGFAGIVKSNNGTTLQLEGYDDSSQSTFLFNVSLASDGKAFDQNNNEITLSQIPVGNVAVGSGEKQSNGDFIAYEVHDNGLPDTGGGEPPPDGGGWQPGDSFQFGGEVAALGSGYLVLKSGDPTTNEVYYDTVYYDSGIVKDQYGNPQSIKVGDNVDGTVVVQSDGRLQFSDITDYVDGPPPGEKFQAGGEVSFVGSDFLVVTWSDPNNGESGTDTLYIPSGLAIVDMDGNAATPQLGDNVGGNIEVQSDGRWLLLDLTVYPPPPQPGDVVKAGGQIAFIGTDFLVVSWQNPDTGESGKDTLYIQSGLVILDDSGNPATPQVGDFVEGEVEIQADKSLLLTSLTIHTGAGPNGEPQDSIPFRGTVVAVGSNYIDVSVDKDGNLETVRLIVDAQSQLFDESGATIQLSAFAAGDTVFGLVDATDPSNIVLDFIRKGTAEAPPGGTPGVTTKAGGQIAFIGPNFLVVNWQNPDTGESGTDTVFVSEGLVAVDDNGNPVTPQVGDFVEGDVEVQTDGSLMLLSLTVHTGGGGNGEPVDSLPFKGTVASVGADYVEVALDRDGNPDTVKLMVDAGTVLLDAAGAALQLSDFAAGDTVFGFFDATDPTNPVLRLLALGPGGMEPVPFMGVVVAIGADYLDIEYPGENDVPDTARVKINNESLLFDQDSSSITLADFAVGDKVFGHVNVLGPDDFTALVITRGEQLEGRTDFVGGSVTEVGADYLMIFFTDKESGDTGTVKVLVDNQTMIFDVDSSAIALSDFAQGDHAFAQGQVTSAGELLATTLTKLQSRPSAEINFTGQIIRIYSDQIFLQGTSPTNITYFLRLLVGDQTNVTDESDNPLDPSSFAVGDQVHGEGSISGDFAVNTALLSRGGGDNLQPGQKVPFSGIITEVGSDYFISEYGYPVLTKRTEIDSRTVIQTASGTSTSLAVGDFISAVSEIASDGSLTALQVRTFDGSQNVPGVRIPLEGQITEVGPDYLLVQDQTEGELKVLILANTLDAAGDPVVAGDYQTGDNLSAGGVIQACELVVLRETAPAQANVTIRGTISAIGPDFLVLSYIDSTGASFSDTVTVDQDTRITDLLGTDLSLEGLFTGDFLIVSGTRDETGRLIGDLIQKDQTRVPPDTLEFHGQVASLGDGYFEISLTDSTGQPVLVRGYLDERTTVTDKDNNPVELKVDDEVSGRGLWIDEGSFTALFVVVESEVIPMPLPGEPADFDGKITEISGTRVNVVFDDPSAPVPSAWVDIPAGTPLAMGNGFPLELAWLAVNDIIYVEGVVNQDSVSVTANKVEYVEGTLRLLAGRVVTVSTASFEMEARNATGRSIIAQVAVGSGARVERQNTGETLAVSDIIKGTIVTSLARLTSGTAFDAILVTVPPPERVQIEGRVLAMTASGFSIEIKEDQNTLKATVLTGQNTIWLRETADGLENAAAGDLVVDDLVHVTGTRAGPLSANADTVIIRDTGELKVTTFTIVDGKLANSSVTFQIDLNEGSGSTPLYAPVALTVTPDFANLSGTVDLSAAGEGIMDLKMVKVSGTSGALTGRWSGYVQPATGGDKVLVNAELIQSGSQITGSVTLGGQAAPGSETVPQAGDEVQFIGQVTSVEAPTIVVTFNNQLNQRVDKPVIVHDGTEIIDVDGKELEIELDSLLSREVDVTGIIQDNLSVVASRIEVYPVSGENDISQNQPQISNLNWSSSTRALQFSLSGDLLDNISSQDVAFDGQLSADGYSLSLKAVVGEDTLMFSARRISGEHESIAGEWSGSVSQTVSDRSKIWPAFLSILERDGGFEGNYEIGESRFKAVVTTRNSPPVFQPVPEVDVTELQSVTVPIAASDPDGDPITLSVSGVQITGSSFTDNGDGTGSYSLTVPQLPAGKNELFVNFAADDGKGGVTSFVVEIEVTKLNRPPELGTIKDTLRTIEGQKFQVSIPVRDPEGGELKFEFDNLPTWARTSSSQIIFEPPFGSAGIYAITVKIDDDQDAEVSHTYYLMVIAANRAPRFTLIEPQEIQSGESVSFTVSASDPDSGDVLTYAAAVIGGVTALPSGAAFDPASGAFSWTPSQEQVGPFKAGFVVTDSKNARALMTVNIFVGQVTAPPTIDVPDTVIASQGESASFTATGQSSTGNEVEFLARNLPTGANWSTLGDSLEWFPSYDQQGEYVITMSASDGSFRTDKDVVIMVNPVQQVATLQPLQDYTVTENQVLRFQVIGTYPNGGPVVFDPPAGLPAGSGFDVLTGSFRFLPDYTQAGSYPLTFSVTAPDQTVYSVSNTVTVTDKNRKPKIANLDNVSVDAGEAVAFTVSATDPDSNETLTYAAENLPQGASFDTSVDPPAFSWIPGTDGTSEVSFTVSDRGQLTDRATVVITVGVQNLPPVLGQLADLKVAEGDTLTLVVSASDPEGEQVSVFVSPLPTNSVFDNDSKTFTFQPSYSQAGRYNLRFVASDGELSDESRITVTVADVALPPRITVPVDWTVNEGDELQFTVNVRDASGNRRPVLSPNLPPGAMLESETGKFFWRPSFDQAGEYQVTFNASDGNLTSQADVRIVVQDVNQPPALFRVAHQEVLEGDLIGFEISVFDPDGDEVTIGIDSSGTPYINSAEIRNSNVFVFNTALLDSAVQIPSAVFKVTADDNRGGADTMSVEFKIIRRDDVNVPDVPPGGSPFGYDFPGTGLFFQMTNNGQNSVNGQITGSETSGTLEPGNTGGTLLAGMEMPDLNSRYPQLAGSKDKVIVRPFLSDGGTTGGDFYGVRRGWGLDLSSDLLGSLTSLQFDLTLSYQDRDIPATDIPEFQESAISIFGLDATGNFVQIATQLDTAANTATAPVDLTLYTDFTLGVILDLAAPVISYTSKLVSTTNENGPYNVITTIVDNVLISNALLYYSIDGQTFNSVAMSPDTVLINGFTADIPGQREGSTIYYFIEASDEEHTVTDPTDAPQSAYQFSILLDGIAGASPGDSNDDGKVDIFDLLDVLNILGGRKAATPGADADGNGRVDIFDLLAVLKML